MTARCALHQLSHLPILRLSYSNLLANTEALLSLFILPSPPILLPQFLLLSFPFQFQIMIDSGKEGGKRKKEMRTHKIYV